MPLVSREIYSIINTEASHIANLKDGQRAIIDDNPAVLPNNNWLHKKDGDIYASSVTKIYTGGAWVKANVQYADVKSTSLSDDFVVAGIPLGETGEVALDGSFSAISIVGALNELLVVPAANAEWSRTDLGGVNEKVEPVQTGGKSFTFVDVGQGLTDSFFTSNMPIADATNNALAAYFGSTVSLVGALNKLSGSAATFSWTYSATIISPPASGGVRFNNVTMASVTEVYLSESTNSGDDASVFIDNIPIGSRLFFSEVAAVGNAVEFLVTGVNDVGASVTYTVTYIDDSGTIVSGANLKLFPVGGGGGGSIAGTDNQVQYNLASAHAASAGFLFFPGSGIDNLRVVSTASGGRIDMNCSGIPFIDIHQSVNERLTLYAQDPVYSKGRIVSAALDLFLQADGGNEVQAMDEFRVLRDPLEDDTTNIHFDTLLPTAFQNITSSDFGALTANLLRIIVPPQGDDMSIQTNSPDDLFLSNSGSGTVLVNDVDLTNLGSGLLFLADDGVYQAVLSGGSAIDFLYRFDTGLGTPPPNKKFRYDNADPTLVQHIYVDDTTDNNQIIFPVLKFFKAGDRLLTINPSDAGDAHLYTIVSNTENLAPDFIDFEVTFDQTTGFGTWSNNQQVVLVFANTGKAPGVDTDAIFNRAGVFSVAASPDFYKFDHTKVSLTMYSDATGNEVGMTAEFGFVFAFDDTSIIKIQVAGTHGDTLETDHDDGLFLRSTGLNEEVIAVNCFRVIPTIVSGDTANVKIYHSGPNARIDLNSETGNQLFLNAAEAGNDSSIILSQSGSDLLNITAGGTGWVTINDVRVRDDLTALVFLNGLGNYVTAGGGSSTFLGLTDSPSSYANFATAIVNVNSAENAVEFTLLSEVLFEEDFESGNALTLVNSGTNVWIRASGAALTGTNSLYISNDGGTNDNYSTSSSATNHAYVDIVIPSNIVYLSLEFDWHCDGEDGVGADQYDFGRVFFTDTGTTPISGTLPTSGAGFTQIGLGKYNNEDDTQGSLIVFTAAQLTAVKALGTMRLVYTWRNDGTQGGQPAFNIDNIVVTGKRDIAGVGTNVIADMQARRLSNATISTSSDITLTWTDIISDSFGNLSGGGQIVNILETGYYTIEVSTEMTLVSNAQFETRLFFTGSDSRTKEQTIFPPGASTFTNQVMFSGKLIKGTEFIVIIRQTSGSNGTILAGSTTELTMTGRRL